MLQSFQPFYQRLAAAHQTILPTLSEAEVAAWSDRILGLLFAEWSNHSLRDTDAVEAYAHDLASDLQKLLRHLEPDLAQTAASHLLASLPAIYDTLLTDATAILEGDPAADSITEIIRTYPGFYAIAIYRLAHLLHACDIPLLPRMLAERAHSRTGIDIHPGAQIGQSFCIDHGTGIVIGATAIIGDYVKIYQGVTLGAISVDKTMARIKRHPTIEHHAVLYAGATVLGGNTTVGHHSLIGGNVWLTESVPAYSRVYHKPQIQVSTSPPVDDSLNWTI